MGFPPGNNLGRAGSASREGADRVPVAFAAAQVKDFGFALACPNAVSFPHIKLVENLHGSASAQPKGSPPSAAAGLYGLQCLEESAGLEKMHDDINACTQDWPCRAR
jgi:hypothetical protein